MTEKCMYNGTCDKDATTTYLFIGTEWRYSLCDEHRALMGYDLIAVPAVEEEKVSPKCVDVCESVGGDEAPCKKHDGWCPYSEEKVNPDG